jgi:hypothetical protein
LGTTRIDGGMVKDGKNSKGMIGMTKDNKDGEKMTYNNMNVLQG